jgi:hypothetical protein
MNKFFKKKLLAVIMLTVGMMSSHAAITDGKFSTAQIWDVQYFWSGTTLNASGFSNLFASVDYDTQATSAARLTDAQIADAASNGRYFSFFNSTTVAGTYGLALYESNGNLYKVINHTGTFTALGSGAIFYLGNGSWGTVITPEGGYSAGQSGTFTNMDTSVSTSDLSSYSYTNTAPLTAGQTASSSTPTLVSTTATTSLVSSSTSNGTTTNVTTVTRGTTTAVTAVTDTATRQSKTVDVNRNIAVTSTTPVTTTVVATTPVTTTTVTTPRNIETYSDNSTVTIAGTPVTTSSVTNTVVTTASTVNEVVNVSTDQQYATKIDQVDQLSAINKRIDYANLSDPLIRNKVSDGAIRARNGDQGVSAYIIGNKQTSNIVDNYSYNNGAFGVGVERRIKSNLLVGAQYIRNAVTLSGVSEAGDMVKDTGGVYAMGTVNNWIIKGDYLYSTTALNWNHQLTALGLSNTGTTQGADQTLAVRVYTPDFKGVRPFIGAQHIWSKRNYAQETGSALTAVDYASIDREHAVQEAGVRFEHTFKQNWTAIAEISSTTDKLSNGSVGLMYNAANKSVFARISQQQQNGVLIDKVEIQARLSF